MLLGFKPRFKEPIQIGTKVFTMRNKRKVQPKIGETLYMYTGLRTSKCELISNKEKLMSVQEVDITISRNILHEISIEVWVDKYCITDEELEQFVRFDGFKDKRDFADYWIASSYSGKKAPTELCIGGKMDLFHWTDLKY